MSTATRLVDRLATRTRNGAMWRSPVHVLGGGWPSLDDDRRAADASFAGTDQFIGNRQAAHAGLSFTPNFLPATVPTPFRAAGVHVAAVDLAGAWAARRRSGLGWLAESPQSLKAVGS